MAAFATWRAARCKIRMPEARRVLFATGGGVAKFTLLWPTQKCGGQTGGVDFAIGKFLRNEARRASGRRRVREADGGKSQRGLWHGLGVVGQGFRAAVQPRQSSPQGRDFRQCPALPRRLRLRIKRELRVQSAHAGLADPQVEDARLGDALVPCADELQVGAGEGEADGPAFARR